MTSYDHYFMSLEELLEYEKYLAEQQSILPEGTTPATWEWYANELESVQALIEKRKTERQIKALEDKAREYMKSTEVHPTAWQAFIQAIKGLFH